MRLAQLQALQLTAERAALSGLTPAPALVNLVRPEHIAAALSQVPEKFVPSGVGTGAEWDVDLVDLSQVPREWLTIDWSKVKIHMREHQKSEVIPGVLGLVFKRVAKVRAR